MKSQDVNRVGGRVALVFLLIFGMTGIATADESNPSTQEMVDKLKGHPPPHSRGIVIVGAAAVAAAADPGKLDLSINFDRGSTRLTTDAELLLDRLAAAMTDPALASARFQIAGHTDAAGSDRANLQLSQRRAQAVVDYLVHQHGVESARLNAAGFGSHQLLDPANPTSAVNRRVEITNLGS